MQKGKSPLALLFRRVFGTYGVNIDIGPHRPRPLLQGNATWTFSDQLQVTLAVAVGYEGEVLNTLMEHSLKNVSLIQSGGIPRRMPSSNSDSDGSKTSSEKKEEVSSPSKDKNFGGVDGDDLLNFLALEESSLQREEEDVAAIVKNSLTKADPTTAGEDQDLDADVDADDSVFINPTTEIFSSSPISAEAKVQEEAQVTQETVIEQLNLIVDPFEAFSNLRRQLQSERFSKLLDECSAVDCSLRFVFQFEGGKEEEEEEGSSNTSSPVNQSVRCRVMMKSDWDPLEVEVGVVTGTCVKAVVDEACIHCHRAVQLEAQKQSQNTLRELELYLNEFSSPFSSRDGDHGVPVCSRLHFDLSSFDAFHWSDGKNIVSPHEYKVALEDPWGNKNSFGLQVRHSVSSIVATVYTGKMYQTICQWYVPVIQDDLSITMTQIDNPGERQAEVRLSKFGYLDAMLVDLHREEWKGDHPLGELKITCCGVGVKPDNDGTCDEPSKDDDSRTSSVANLPLPPPLPSNLPASSTLRYTVSWVIDDCQVASSAEGVVVAVAHGPGLIQCIRDCLLKRAQGLNLSNFILQYNSPPLYPRLLSRFDPIFTKKITSPDPAVVKLWNGFLRFYLRSTGISTVVGGIENWWGFGLGFDSSKGYSQAAIAAGAFSESFQAALGIKTPLVAAPNSDSSKKNRFDSRPITSSLPVGFSSLAEMFYNNFQDVIESWSWIRLNDKNIKRQVTGVPDPFTLSTVQRLSGAAVHKRFNKSGAPHHYGGSGNVSTAVASSFTSKRKKDKKIQASEDQILTRWKNRLSQLTEFGFKKALLEEVVGDRLSFAFSSTSDGSTELQVKTKGLFSQGGKSLHSEGKNTSESKLKEGNDDGDDDDSDLNTSATAVSLTTAALASLTEKHLNVPSTVIATSSSDISGVNSSMLVSHCKSTLQHLMVQHDSISDFFLPEYVDEKMSTGLYHSVILQQVVKSQIQALFGMDWQHHTVVEASADGSSFEAVMALGSADRIVGTHGGNDQHHQKLYILCKETAPTKATAHHAVEYKFLQEYASETAECLKTMMIIRFFFHHPKVLAILYARYVATRGVPPIQPGPFSETKVDYLAKPFVFVTTQLADNGGSIVRYNSKVMIDFNVSKASYPITLSESTHSSPSLSYVHAVDSALEQFTYDLGLNPPDAAVVDSMCSISDVVSLTQPITNTGSLQEEIEEILEIVLSSCRDKVLANALPQCIVVGRRHYLNQAHSGETSPPPPPSPFHGSAAPTGEFTKQSARTQSDGTKPSLIATTFGVGTPLSILHALQSIVSRNHKHCVAISHHLLVNKKSNQLEMFLVGKTILGTLEVLQHWCDDKDSSVLLSLVGLYEKEMASGQLNIDGSASSALLLHAQGLLSKRVLKNHASIFHHRPTMSSTLVPMMRAMFGISAEHINAREIQTPQMQWLAYADVTQGWISKALAPLPPSLTLAGVSVSSSDYVLPQKIRIEAEIGQSKKAAEAYVVRSLWNRCVKILGIPPFEKVFVYHLPPQPVTERLPSNIAGASDIVPPPAVAPKVPSVPFKKPFSVPRLKDPPTPVVSTPFPTPTTVPRRAPLSQPATAASPSHTFPDTSNPMLLQLQEAVKAECQKSAPRCVVEGFQVLLRLIADIALKKDSASKNDGGKQGEDDGEVTIHYLYEIHQNSLFESNVYLYKLTCTDDDEKKVVVWDSGSNADGRNPLMCVLDGYLHLLVLHAKNELGSELPAVDDASDETRVTGTADSLNEFLVSCLRYMQKVGAWTPSVPSNLLHVATSSQLLEQLLRRYFNCTLQQIDGMSKDGSNGWTAKVFMKPNEQIPRPLEQSVRKLHQVRILLNNFLTTELVLAHGFGNKKKIAVEAAAKRALERNFPSWHSGSLSRMTMDLEMMFSRQLSTTANAKERDDE